MSERYTSKVTIRLWLYSAKEQGATHLLVVQDDPRCFEDTAIFPVAVMPDENVKDKVKRYRGKQGHNVVAVYNLAMNIEAQLQERNPRHLASDPLENVPVLDEATLCDWEERLRTAESGRTLARMALWLLAEVRPLRAEKGGMG